MRNDSDEFYGACFCCGGLFSLDNKRKAAFLLRGVLSNYPMFNNQTFDRFYTFVIRQMDKICAACPSDAEPIYYLFCGYTADKKALLRIGVSDILQLRRNLPPSV